MQQNLVVDGSQQNNGAFYLCRHLDPFAMTWQVLPAPGGQAVISAGKRKVIRPAHGYSFVGSRAGTGIDQNANSKPKPPPGTDRFHAFG